MTEHAGDQGTGVAALEHALEQYRAGRFVVLTDSTEREAEGALTMAAEFVTPDAIAFLAQHGRGLICVALTAQRLDELKIPSVQGAASTPFAAPFTVPVEARYGVTTGISGQDRARTIRVLIDPHSGPADIAMPGHMFPLRTRPGGVLARAGQAEAAVDLARLAELYPAGVLCAIMHGTGTASVSEVRRFARRHGLALVSIKDLIAYRLAREQLVTRVTEARLPTAHGEFVVYAYRSAIESGEHLALGMGDLSLPAPLVCIREQCLAGDVLGSRRCDCGGRTQRGLAAIAAEGRGVLLYLRPEDRGIGLHNDLRLYGIQQPSGRRGGGGRHLDREYGVAVQMLRDLGVTSVRLLEEDAADAEALRVYGLEVSLAAPAAPQPQAEGTQSSGSEPVRIGTQNQRVQSGR